MIITAIPLRIARSVQPLRAAMGVRRTQIIALAIRRCAFPFDRRTRRPTVLRKRGVPRLAREKFVKLLYLCKKGLHQCSEGITSEDSRTRKRSWRTAAGPPPPDCRCGLFFLLEMTPTPTPGLLLLILAVW